MIARGAIVTAATGAGYGGKPRPAVVIQSTMFEHLDSTVLCLLTTERLDVPSIRLAVPRSVQNGLAEDSWVMVDKILTIPHRKIGRVVGRLEEDLLDEMSRLLSVFLGLAQAADA